MMMIAQPLLCVSMLRAACCMIAFIALLMTDHGELFRGEGSRLYFFPGEYDVIGWWRRQVRVNAGWVDNSTDDATEIRQRSTAERRHWTAYLHQQSLDWRLSERQSRFPYRKWRPQPSGRCGSYLWTLSGILAKKLFLQVSSSFLFMFLKLEMITLILKRGRVALHKLKVL